MARRNVFLISLASLQLALAQVYNNSNPFSLDRNSCPPLAKCLADETSMTEVSCASLHSLLLTAWRCAKVQTGQQQVTFAWRDDDQTGNCWRLAKEYPELNEVFRCHNDFYDKITQMHKEACQIEQTFVRCMEWPIAELINCEGGSGSSLAGSTVVLDIQLPHKKNLVNAQNVCMRYHLTAERDCLRDGLAKCRRPESNRFPNQNDPNPINSGESKLERCLKLKAEKETDAVKRADVIIGQLQESLNSCLDIAESQLLARVRQTVSTSPTKSP